MLPMRTLYDRLVGLIARAREPAPPGQAAGWGLGPTDPTLVEFLRDVQSDARTDLQERNTALLEESRRLRDRLERLEIEHRQTTIRLNDALTRLERVTDAE